MMEGIEIVRKTPITEMSNMSTGIIVMLLFVLCFGGVLFFAGGISGEFETMIAGFIIVIVAAIFTGTCAVFGEVETGKYKYEVIISDESVSMKEFNENYEIIEQDGIILTIIERE